MKDGWSIYRIAKHLERPYNTIKNEIKRGTVSLYQGKVERYKADEGKKVYLEHRQNIYNYVDKKSGYSKTFLAEHEQEILLNKAAKKVFDEMKLQKLPTVKSQNDEFAEVVRQKKSLYAEYS